MNDAPRVTVSLVTYNGRRWLDGCLESLHKQRFVDYELLVFDNGSSDGTATWLSTTLGQDPVARLTLSERNLGFAAAHNRQIEMARGRYVLLLNQDVELDEQFLEYAVAALEERPGAGAVQARLRWLDRPRGRTTILDSTGLVMGRTRRVVARRQREPERSADLVPGPVWGVDGPAPVYRLAALRDARVPTPDGRWETLDEDFFMYKEDVDLAWRMRLLGWSSWYEPRALAWHARGAGVGAPNSFVAAVRSSRTIPRWIKALSWRNQRLMQIKNDRASDVVRDLPWIVLHESMSLALIALTDPIRLLSIAGLISQLPKAIRKRRLIQRRVRLRDGGPGSAAAARR